MGLTITLVGWPPAPPQDPPPTQADSGGGCAGEETGSVWETEDGPRSPLFSAATRWREFPQGLEDKDTASPAPPRSGEGRASSSTHHQHPCDSPSLGLPTRPGLGGLRPGSRAGPCSPPAVAGAGQLAGGRDRPGLRLWPWDSLWVGCLGGEAAPLPVPGFHRHLLLSDGSGLGRPGGC